MLIKANFGRQYSNNDQKLKFTYFFDSAVSLLGIYPEVCQDMCTRKFTAALFINQQEKKKPYLLVTNW